MDAASEDDHDTAGRVVEEEEGQDEDWEELCRRVWEVVRNWRRGEIAARITRGENPASKSDMAVTRRRSAKGAP